MGTGQPQSIFSGSRWDHFSTIRLKIHRAPSLPNRPAFPFVRPGPDALSQVVERIHGEFNHVN